jgi:hypothetical protein
MVIDFPSESLTKNWIVSDGGAVEVDVRGRLGGALLGVVAALLGVRSDWGVV